MPLPRAPLSSSLLVLLLFLGRLGVGCHGGEESRWVTVEVDGVLTPLEDVVGTWTGRGSEDVSFRVEAGALWIEAGVPVAAWRETEWPGIWEVDRPMRSAVARPDRDGVALWRGEVPYARNTAIEGKEALASLAVDSFFLTADVIVLRVEGADRPPADIRFGVLEGRIRCGPRPAPAWSSWSIWTGRRSFGMRRS